MNCPKCHSSVPEGEESCLRCGHQLASSAGPKKLSRGDDAEGSIELRFRSVEVESEADLPWEGEDETAAEQSAYGGDALILGDLGFDFHSFHGESGAFVIRDSNPRILAEVEPPPDPFLAAQTELIDRVVLPAPVYIDEATAALLRPDSVPGLVDGDTSTITPIERFILEHVDGQRPVRRIQERTKLSDDDLRIALAMLVDRGLLRLMGLARQGPSSSPAIPVVEPAPEAPFDEATVAELPEAAGFDVQQDGPVPRPITLPAAEALPKLEAQARAALAKQKPLDGPPVAEEEPTRNPFRTKPAEADATKQERPAAVRAKPKPSSAPEPQAAEPPTSKPAAPEPPAREPHTPQPPAPEPKRKQEARSVARRQYEPPPPPDRRLGARQGKFAPVVEKKAPAASRPAGGPKPKEVLLYEEASKKEAEGDSEGALELLERAARINPKAAPVHNRRGVLLAIRFKRYREAVDALMLAVELDPRNGTYRTNLNKVMGKVSSEGGGEPAGAGGAAKALVSFLKNKIG